MKLWPRVILDINSSINSENTEVLSTKEPVKFVIATARNSRTRKPKFVVSGKEYSDTDS